MVHGFIEIYLDGLWGTLCSSDSLATGNVACRQLGYRDGTTQVPPGNGLPDAQFAWGMNIRCDGREDSLILCQHDPWRMRICEFGLTQLTCCKSGNTGTKVIHWRK